MSEDTVDPIGNSSFFYLVSVVGACALYVPLSDNSH